MADIRVHIENAGRVGDCSCAAGIPSMAIAGKCSCISGIPAATRYPSTFVLRHICHPGASRKMLLHFRHPGG
jgi:hypothetical protein